MERIKDQQAKNTVHRVELNIVKVPEGMISHGRTIKLARKPDLHDRVMQMGPNPNERVKRDPDEERERRPSTRVAAPPPSKGKLKLNKFRKEAKAMGHFQHHTKSPSGVWSAKEMTAKPLPTSKNLPTISAPRCLIEEHRKPASSQPVDPTTKRPTIFAPRKKRIEHEHTTSPALSISEEAENRLKAFTNHSSVESSRPTPGTPKCTTGSGQSEARAPTLCTATLIPQEYDMDTPLPSIEDPATLQVPKPPITSSITPPTECSARDFPAPGYRVPRPKTSSPNTGTVRPPMRMKAKAPVDIFMPRAKRQRVA